VGAGRDGAPALRGAGAEPRLLGAVRRAEVKREAQPSVAVGARGPAAHDVGLAGAASGRGQASIAHLQVEELAPAVVRARLPAPRADVVVRRGDREAAQPLRRGGERRPPRARTARWPARTPTSATSAASVWPGAWSWSPIATRASRMRRERARSATRCATPACWSGPPAGTATSSTSARRWCSRPSTSPCSSTPSRARSRKRRSGEARRRRCFDRGVRVQSAATAAGRADRRSLLPGGHAAVFPPDAATDAVGRAHRQPRGALLHPCGNRRRRGRIRRRRRAHHAHPRRGVRLSTDDPVGRRAFHAVGAGAVPVAACDRAARPAGDGGGGVGWPRRG
jgi:hypothetical protein